MRFPNYNDNWCSNTIDELFLFLRNNTLSRDDLNYENGSCKNIHYGDILTKFNTLKDVSDSDVPFINNNIVSKNDLLYSNDIVIADTAEDYIVGKAIEIKNSNNVYTYSGLHTIPLRPKNKFASGFIAFNINSYSFRKRIHPLIQGIKVYSISKSALLKTKVYYPSFNEQSIISKFIQHLEERILTQKKIINVLESQMKSISSLIYKRADSNIELAKIATFEKKTNHKSEDGLDFGLYPFYTNEEVQTKYFDSYDYDGLYILANTGGKANFKLVDGKFAVMSDTLVIKFNDTKLAKTYINFFVNNKMRINNDYFAGSGLKHLDKTSFSKLKLPILNIDIDALNDFFEVLTKRINLNKKILLLLEKQKQYLLDKMFI